MMFSSKTGWTAWDYSQYQYPYQEECDPLKTSAQMIKIPILKNAWQMTKRCDLQQPKDTAFAIIIFENAWEQTFGSSPKLLMALHSLMVEWSTEKKNRTAFHLDGVKYINSPVVGLTRTPSWIWVHTQHRQKICETSFVHELVHVAIWAEKSTDGDPDHEGHQYSGWTPEHTRFIRRVNKALCAIRL